MQPLNDPQLAEHTAILGKVKLDKGLETTKLSEKC
jgi:hypothetical protein